MFFLFNPPKSVKIFRPVSTTANTSSKPYNIKTGHFTVCISLRISNLCVAHAISKMFLCLPAIISQSL